MPAMDRYTAKVNSNDTRSLDASIVAWIPGVGPELRELVELTLLFAPVEDVAPSRPRAP
jgi:hypothetical protein